MKAIVAVLLFMGIVAALPNPNSFKDKFKEFQTKYNKTYASTEEHDQRFKNFVRNMAKAQYWQSRETGTATYGMTKFSDLSEEEFRTNYLMPRELHATINYTRAPQLETTKLAAIPQDGMDWRDKGAVTPVYNQGSCGSCWAFSATETIESYYKLCGHSLSSLSVQQIVDCDSSSYGCQGGWTESAYEYILNVAKGQESWSRYPYTGRDGSCKFNKNDIAAKISKWGYVTTSKDESKMLDWVTSQGPMSVCVDASQWSSYTGGVVRSCGKNIDHCVMVTGYSTVSGYPVWHVRNSWGTDWGVSGYMYVERNKDVCAIAQDVTAVVC